MKFKVVRWYDGIKIETFVPDFETAYQEYIENDNCDTVQIYFLKETSNLLAQRECQHLDTI